jgi:hypothetical protein
LKVSGTVVHLPWTSDSSEVKPSWRQVARHTNPVWRGLFIASAKKKLLWESAYGEMGIDHSLGRRLTSPAPADTPPS